MPASYVRSAGLPTSPKDPCTCIVYTWAVKLLYRNPFKAQVYTIQVHGSFRTGNKLAAESLAVAEDKTAARSLSTATTAMLLLEGSWYLLTNYNCTYNPTYNTPKGPYRGYPHDK